MRVAAIAVAVAVATALSQAQPGAAPGPAIKRVANMPDGAPAFEVLDIRGEPVRRIECIWNGWYDSDSMATRLLGAPSVMAAIITKAGHISLEDLGPAHFDCVVVPAKKAAPR